MIQNKRILYLSIALLLIITIDTLALNGLFGKTSYLQEKIESLLPKKEVKDNAECENIRVLIKTNGFAQITHNEVEVKANSGLIIAAGNEKIEYVSAEPLNFKPDDENFQAGAIKISPQNPDDKLTITSLTRGYGAPNYRGTLELISTAEGIVIINELPLEEYLYGVVPSEMPASYEMEALKAQAVCARSYAYNQTREYSYPEYQAHVDDSVSFQVYGNSMEQDSTVCAVDETCGEKIWYGDTVATTYYYSTSCGKTASIEAWGSEMDDTTKYLQSVEVCNSNGEAYERDLPWYRWTATISAETLCNLLEMNAGTEIGTLKSFEVTKQGDGGIAQQITAVGTQGKLVVETENKIRSALGGSGYTIEKQDGTVIESTKLLPSAFFTVTKNGESYILNGGGYGHGIGMSQNGANEMAKAGADYKEILTTFYTGVKVR